jgi:hypothetical protein
LPHPKFLFQQFLWQHNPSLSPPWLQSCGKPESMSIVL